jgi:molecular chaperone HtpG
MCVSDGPNGSGPNGSDPNGDVGFPRRNGPSLLSIVPDDGGGSGIASAHATTSRGTVREAQVDLGALMTVLSDHLYSTPEVAIRELVQNAHDSITRRRIENPDLENTAHENTTHESPIHENVAGATESMIGRIEVWFETNPPTIRIVDNGAGLTAYEIDTYLATVGAGYTRTLRVGSSGGNDELIGQFGLGFLSAFVLADEVTVTTTSVTSPAEGNRYRSANALNYRIDPAPARAVGTEVSLLLKERFGYLASSEQLRRVLDRYAVLLREQIVLGNDQAVINDNVPPWRSTRDDPTSRRMSTDDRRKRLEFARHFERHFEPLCTVDIAPELASAGPTAMLHNRISHKGSSSAASKTSSDVRGLLWVQDGSSYGSADNRNLSVFVRGMLLDDDARDLLPPWAGFIGGVVESTDLTPTASREDLQKDDAWRAAQFAISEQLIAGLAAIAKSDAAAWRRVLVRHNQAMLGAALADDRLFEFLAEDVQIPTSMGDLTATELRRGGRGRIHVAFGGENGFEEMLCRARQVPVARGTRYAVLPFLREWCQRNKAELVEIGTDIGNKRMFTAATLSPKHIEHLSGWLLDDGEDLVPARFTPIDVPLVRVPDREAELKRRIESDESDARMTSMTLRLARLHTATLDDSAMAHVYVNVDCPAIVALLQAADQSSDHIGAQTAARLLRSFKLLTGVSGEASRAIDLSGAFGGLSDAVTMLCVTTTNHGTEN